MEQVVLGLAGHAEAETRIQATVNSPIGGIFWNRASHTEILLT
ncbi:hypothetical protein [Pedobacter alpinus]